MPMMFAIMGSFGFGLLSMTMMTYVLTSRFCNYHRTASSFPYKGPPRIWFLTRRSAFCTLRRRNASVNTGRQGGGSASGTGACI